jgi:hypothetical protein
MRGEVKDWGESRFGVQLALSPHEIAMLIRRLRVLERDSEQHFHMTATDQSAVRLGDIEISVLAQDQPHNMDITSVAIPPGAEIKLGKRGRLIPGPRRALIAGVCWIVAILAGLEATAAQYVTYITDDYGPILVRGVWMCLVALVSLFGAALAVKTWKARVPSVAGALLILFLLRGLLERLAPTR